MGAPAENEIVVPRFPSTLGPATGDAHETLGLSTVKTLSGSPWLASASPETLSPASTTTAMTKMRAAFGLPRRTCLAIDSYPSLCVATCRSPRLLLGQTRQPPSPPSGKDANSAGQLVVNWPWRLLTGRFEAVERSWGQRPQGVETPGDGQQRPLLLGGGGPPQRQPARPGRRHNNAGVPD